MNKMYKEIMLDEIFEKGLRSVSENAIVYIAYKGKKFAIPYGCGVQEGSYYIQGILASNSKLRFLNAGQILYMIDTQKENAISECRDKGYDVENIFEECMDDNIDNQFIYEKIGLDSIGIFLDEEESDEEFYNRCCEAYFFGCNSSYSIEKDRCNNEIITFMIE